MANKKPPDSQPNPPPPSDGGSASFKNDTYQQPLGEPTVEGPPPPGASVDATADIGVQLVSAGCYIRWQAGLTQDEAVDLKRDLAAVLEKYDAPNIPCSEEVRLALNLGGIAWRRMQVEFAQAQAATANDPAANPPKPEPERSVVDDSVSVGQEGQWQNGVDATAGRTRAGSEARDLIS